MGDPLTPAAGSSDAPTLPPKPAALQNDESEICIPVDPPYRNKHPRTPKSILKPPPAPVKGFSFKRDILSFVPLPAAESQALERTVEKTGALWSSVSRRITGATASSLSYASSVLPHGGTKSGPTSPALKETSPQLGATQHAAPVNASTLSLDSVKSVKFTMSDLSVTYPINIPDPPGAEAHTRKRINSEHRKRRSDRTDKGWTGEELLKLYDDCCGSREEAGITKVRKALRESSSSPPKSFDLSRENLTLGSLEALSDLLMVEFGLQKLVMEASSLDDNSLRPLVHSLLVSGTITTLNLADNRRIRSKGWKLIAILIQQSQNLKFLDISHNQLDRKSVDYFVQAFINAPIPKNLESASMISSSSSESSDANYYNSESDDSPLRPSAPLLRRNAPTPGHQVSLASLRFENCGLRGQSLEALSHCIRTSEVKHISLRKNRINQQGAVSLATMIRDYPFDLDQKSQIGSPRPNLSLPEPYSPVLPSPVLPNSSLPFEFHNSVTARKQPTPSVSSPPRPVNGHSKPPSQPEGETFGPEKGSSMSSPTMDRDVEKARERRAIMRKQIDALPRVGALLTLDVKSNDLRSGVVYIAQVLKRNRTLRVLNLSDNKIDGTGLMALADALKYNSTLETLDLSGNPCCSLGTEGIVALRTAFVYNTTLMRLFLANTNLSSEGAISIAEFMPDLKSLIHLDLTENPEIDISGVMALSVSLKLNQVMRCLDLSIPPNSPEFAALSQDILQSCIRNTEMAQQESTARGIKIPVSAPILKSTVARELQELQASAPKPVSLGDLLIEAENCVELLNDIITSDEAGATPSKPLEVGDVVKDLLAQAKRCRKQLLDSAGPSIDLPSEQREKASTVIQAIDRTLQRVSWIYGKRPAVVTSTTPSKPERLSPVKSSAEPTSPNFSITSDSDSDISSVEEGMSTPSRNERPKMTLDVTPTRKADSSPTRSPVEEVSKKWTHEEGEVLRRHAILEQEDDTETPGEQLKDELLETEVERQPRSIPSPDEEAAV